MISKCSLENHPGHAICFSSKLMICISQGMVMFSLLGSQNFWQWKAQNINISSNKFLQKSTISRII
jgi:hypothetical protein